MSDAKLNRTLTDEIKKKISNSMTGRTFSEERKLNLSLSKRNSKKLTVLRGGAALRVYDILRKGGRPLPSNK
jgi:ribosomal protein L4